MIVRVSGARSPHHSFPAFLDSIAGHKTFKENRSKLYPYWQVSYYFPKETALLYDCLLACGEWHLTRCYLDGEPYKPKAIIDLIECFRLLESPCEMRREILHPSCDICPNQKVTLALVTPITEALRLRSRRRRQGEWTG